MVIQLYHLFRYKKRGNSVLFSDYLRHQNLKIVSERRLPHAPKSNYMINLENFFTKSKFLDLAFSVLLHFSNKHY